MRQLWYTGHEDWLRWNELTKKIVATLEVLANNNVNVLSVTVPRWMYENQYRYLCKDFNMMDVIESEKNPVPTLDTWSWGVCGPLPLLMDTTLPEFGFRIEIG